MITFDRLKKWLEWKTRNKFGELAFRLSASKSSADAVDFLALTDADGFLTCLACMPDKAERVDMRSKDFMAKAEDTFVKHFLSHEMMRFSDFADKDNKSRLFHIG